MFVIPPGNNIKKPIKIWAQNQESIEEGCLEQARNLSNLPFLFKHVALMPDTHQGYGMPIGGVIATENIIIPNAVGVDIGCGMVALKTNLDKEAIYNIRDEIGREILENIPTGFEHHKTPKVWNIWEMYDNVLDRKPGGIRLPNRYGGEKSTPVFFENRDAIRYQLGTLGGGNHFIEIQYDEEDYVWIMVHSGSRNFGKQVCDYYNKKSKELNERWFSQVPSQWQLAFLPIEEDLFSQYWYEMHLALEFAYYNRYEIMNNLIKILKVDSLPNIRSINIHHNYASLENHFGKNVFVHRKGATFASDKTMGIIPGSMGSNSYIVKGKGNSESFRSCSHGAGRAMGRNEAKKEFTKEKVLKDMEQRNVKVFKKDMTDVAEECVWAYKDIDEVMENQRDLVEIVHTLKPILCIKG